MRHDKYLGELATELRLRMPEDDTADLVAQIATHIDSSPKDPVDELGDPAQLALDLAKSHGASITTIASRLLWSIASAFGLFLALSLVAGTGRIEGSTVTNALVQAVVIGGITLLVRGRLRAGMRSGDPKIFLGFIAGIAVFAGLGAFALSSVEVGFDVANARLIGVVLGVASVASLLYLYRPLPFERSTGLTSNLFTGYVKTKTRRNE